jgi:hypothetical protein
MWRSLTVGLLSVVALFWFAVLATCRIYWAHWLFPPSAEETIAGIQSLDRFSHYPRAGVATSGSEALREEARSENWVAGESPLGRLPAALQRQRLSPISEEAVPADQLDRVGAALERMSLRERGAETYYDTSVLYGHLASGRSPSGEELLAVALSAGETSNDHYPYYEALFRSSGSGELTLLSYRRY